MKQLGRFALLIGAALLATSTASQTAQPQDGHVRRAARWAIGHYIVVLADDADAETVTRDAGVPRGAQRQHLYRHAFNGFSIRLPPVAAEQLARDPRVKYVQQDGVVELAQTVASWGLDRIDQRLLPLDGFYDYDGLGIGVFVHVIDTGVRVTHQEFGNRATIAGDYVDDDGSDTTPDDNDDGTPGEPDGSDCNGHGTHVAATIGGASFGVARGVMLRSHRVLSCSGAGFVSDVIAAVEAVTASSDRPAVVNLSLSGAPSDALDDAIRSSIQAGVVYVVAAGNQNAPASDYSPARVEEAITVGATTSTDARASFSNHGSRVDLFAPGVSIVSAWHTSDTAGASLSGTSMAAPHVAGLAALLLEQDPELTPADVEQAVVASATPNVLNDVQSGSPNRLLHADLDHASAPVVAISRPLAGEQVLSGGPYKIRWNASDPEGLQQIDVLLSTDGGQTFSSLTECSGLPASATQCAWQSPAPVTTTAQVKVIARDLTGDEAFGSTANFSVVTKPDLIVSTLGNPPGLLGPGTSFSISDTVRNVGSLTAAATTARYYLSLDAVKSSNDVLVASRNVPSLVENAGSPGTPTAIVPSSMTGGQYWLLACADAVSAVVEADETNNCMASVTTLRVELPDLVITAFPALPTAVAPGVAFPAITAVQNQGTTTAGTSTTRFYFSGDTVKNAGDVLLTGSRNVGTLAAGAAVNGAASLTVPTGTALGQYYLLACADAELDVREVVETNNCLATGASLSLTRPDLVTTSVGNPPAAAAPGAQFAVNTTVVNQSAVAAASSTLRFYLSLNGLKDSGDSRVSATRSIVALNPGVPSTGKTTLTVPDTLAAGTYHLIACADDTLKVVELDENNCVAAASTMLVARPDLVITDVANPPAIVAPGGQFTVRSTVRNASAVSAAASTVRFYLSADQVKGVGDVLVTGTQAVNVLGANASTQGNATLTVPAATLPQSAVYLLSCADDLAKVAESDENNCRPATATLQIVRPDLEMVSITGPATAAPGIAFSAVETLRNLSPATVAASTGRYYLSLDAIKDQTDVLTGKVTTGSLVPGATATVTRALTAPTTTALGTYYLIGCADDPSAIVEADESNNCRLAAARVRLSRPDLTTASVSDPPPYVNRGGTLAITDSAANDGEHSAAASTTRYYLSLDDVKDASDIMFAVTRTVAALAVGQTATATRTLTVPAATPDGRYVVLACADDLKVVVELDEGNNCLGSAVDFVVGPPNARPVADAGNDDDLTLGSTVQLDGTRSSDGDGQPLTYSWTLLARPEGSTASFFSTTSSSPSFVADVAGQYVVQLTVYDGREYSVPDVATFTTGGAVRFVAIGDTGLGDAGQYKGGALIKSTCERSGCDFVVMLGDNIYSSGVSSVSDEQFTTKFELPYADVNAPFYVVLGNHDYGGGGDGDEFFKGQFEVDYTAVSAKWRMPAAFYHFTAGTVEFFGLDTNMQMFGQDAQQRQDVASWMTSSTASWKIALGHHPYRSNGSHGNAGRYNNETGVPVTSGDGVKSFMEDVVCGRADLLLSGHDHNLQWLQPNGTCAGTELIVSGAGANPKSLRSPLSPNYNQTYFQAPQLGFVYIVVTANQLTAEFVGQGDRTLYVRTISKTP